MGATDEKLQAMLDSIPYVRSHGVSVSVEADGDVIVMMPWREGLANIMGGWHASALYCGAETAAGVAAWCIAASPDVLTLVREARVRYVRRPEGTVTFVARVGGGARDALAALAEGGRAATTVSVVGADAKDATVLEVDFDYALREGARR